MTLNLTIGQSVRLINQQEWDIKQSGSQGHVSGVNADGHYMLAVNHQRRYLGLWWLDAARRGAIPFIPIVNV
jgi:hypothetical protein